MVWRHGLRVEWSQATNTTEICPAEQLSTLGGGSMIILGRGRGSKGYVSCQNFLKIAGNRYIFGRGGGRSTPRVSPRPANANATNVVTAARINMQTQPRACPWKCSTFVSVMSTIYSSILRNSHLGNFRCHWGRKEGGTVIEIFHWKLYWKSPSKLFYIY